MGGSEEERERVGIPLVAGMSGVCTVTKSAMGLELHRLNFERCSLFSRNNRIIPDSLYVCVRGIARNYSMDYWLTQ